MLSGEQLATTPTPPAAQARTGLAATLTTAPIPGAALAIRAVRATADGSYHQILPLVRTAQRLNGDDYPASKQFAPALAGRVSAQIAGSRAVRKLPDLPLMVRDPADGPSGQNGALIEQCKRMRPSRS
jgi:hypothetical protein